MSNASAYLEAAKQVVDMYGDVKNIISDSRPVLDMNTVVANAIPQDASAMDMVAAGTNVHAVYYNAEWTLGVVDWTTTATIKIAWAYGARWQGGGAYIPAVYAWCDAVDPSTGQDLSVTFDALPPYVQGDNAPYAVLPIRVTIREESLTDTYYEAHQFALMGYGGPAIRL